MGPTALHWPSILLWLRSSRMLLETAGFPKHIQTRRGWCSQLSWCVHTGKSLSPPGQEQGCMKYYNSGSLLSCSEFRKRLEHSCFCHFSLSRSLPWWEKNSTVLRRGNVQGTTTPCHSPSACFHGHHVLHADHPCPKKTPPKPNTKTKNTIPELCENTSKQMMTSCHRQKPWLREFNFV